MDFNLFRKQHHFWNVKPNSVSTCTFLLYIIYFPVKTSKFTIKRSYIKAQKSQKRISHFNHDRHQRQLPQNANTNALFKHLIDHANKIEHVKSLCCGIRPKLYYTSLLCTTYITQHEHLFIFYTFFLIRRLLCFIILLFLYFD